MKLARILDYFETSPAIGLLRSPLAPFVVDFLDRQFKQGGRIAIPHPDLVAALAAYREDLQETHPGRLVSKPEDYLSEWCSAGKRWLQRFVEAARDEPAYQLTPHAEEVLAFLDRVLGRELGFVGTESRLKLVIDTLADLAIGASDDPATRLGHLREEQARIAAEIERIESEGRVAKYRPAQIRERFATAVSLLRQLQGDFREVEEEFRRITAQVQQRQVAGQEPRGAILEFALDAEDVLKGSDQGASFHEFVRLVLSPSQTERLERIIREVRSLPELLQQPEGLETVRGMISLLQNEAEKVMRTNGRLSATLRRLLDVRAHAERQRLARLLRDIRASALRLGADPAADGFGATLELKASVDSAWRRGFWSAPVRFEAIDPRLFAPDEADRIAAFREFAALRHLDWDRMRERVGQMLQTEEAPTLGDLLERHPAEDVVEVVGYLQIAVDDGHRIDPSVRQTITLAATVSGRRAPRLTIPRVTWIAPRSNGHAR